MEYHKSIQQLRGTGSLIPLAVAASMACVTGDVSSVTQAIEAATANGIKDPVAHVVIPSPHEEILKLIENSANRVC